MLDSNPASALAETLSVATDELESTFANVETTISKSTIANVELLNSCPIDIYHSIQIPDIKDFPVEDFFRLPFSHHIKIIEGCKDIQERYYFIHRAVEENVPSDSLPRFIKNNINVEEIGLRDSIDVDERVVEHEIVNKVKNFIMTLGRDFTFMGNQQLLEVYGVEHFPDLLFFNRELNAMVVIELKTGEFKTSYLGQLMGYLTILDEKVRKSHENPSIGIVLCKSANREYVEFMIRDYSKPRERCSQVPSA